MMRILRYISIAMLVAWLNACGNKPPEVPLDSLVEVKKFSYLPVIQTMDYPGRVQARYETELAFQVGGQLIERLVEVGDRVKEGQPIAMLDPKDYVLSSERSLNRRKAAEADLQRAKNDLVRARELRKKNFIGQSELDKAVNIEKALQAGLKALKAEHAQSINQRGYTQLLAPADGLVTGLYAEVGDIMRTGEAVAKLVWDKDWEFVTAVAETDINQVSIGQQAQIKFWAYGDKKHSSLVREISPVISSASPSYQVKLSLIDKPDSLKLGMTGHVLFSTVAEKIGLLPTASLIESDGTSSVFVIEPDTQTAHLQAVTFGQAVDNQMTILSGLTEGQLIVIAGANKIADGSKIRLLLNDE